MFNVEIKNLAREAEVDQYSVALGRNGADYFKELYMEELRKTPQYQQLLKANTPAERIRAAENADSKAVDFRKLENVKLPTQNVEGFTSNTKAYQDRLRKFEAELPEGMAKVKELKAMKGHVSSLEQALKTEKSFYQRRHQDSKEFTKMQDAILDFTNYAYTAKLPYTASPDFKEKLMKAYKASVRYQEQKRKEAKVADSDKTWEPSSPMGQARYAAAGEIQKLAKQYIMEDIVKEAQREEDTEISFDKGSVLDRINREMYKDVVDYDARPETIASNCAGIIALRMYGKALQEAGVKVPGYQKACEQIIVYRNKIMERADFQYMISHNSYNQLSDLAALDNGKMLLPKLAEARKAMSAEEAVKEARQSSSPQLTTSQKESAATMNSSIPLS